MLHRNAIADTMYATAVQSICIIAIAPDIYMAM